MTGERPNPRARREQSADELAALEAIIDELHKGKPVPYLDVLEVARCASARAGGGVLTMPGSGLTRPIHMQRFIRLTRRKLNEAGLMTNGRGGKPHTCAWRMT